MHPSTALLPSPISKAVSNENGHNTSSKLPALEANFNVDSQLPSSPRISQDDNSRKEAISNLSSAHIVDGFPPAPQKKHESDEESGGSSGPGSPRNNATQVLGKSRKTNQELAQEIEAILKDSVVPNLFQICLANSFCGPFNDLIGDIIGPSSSSRQQPARENVERFADGILNSPSTPIVDSKHLGYIASRISDFEKQDFEGVNWANAIFLSLQKSIAKLNSAQKQALFCAVLLRKYDAAPYDNGTLLQAINSLDRGGFEQFQDCILSTLQAVACREFLNSLDFNTLFLFQRELNCTVFQKCIRAIKDPLLRVKLQQFVDMATNETAIRGIRQYVEEKREFNKLPSSKTFEVWQFSALHELNEAIGNANCMIPIINELVNTRGSFFLVREIISNSNLVKLYTAIVKENPSISDGEELLRIPRDLPLAHPLHKLKKNPFYSLGETIDCALSNRSGDYQDKIEECKRSYIFSIATYRFDLERLGDITRLRRDYELYLSLKAIRSLCDGSETESAIEDHQHKLRRAAWHHVTFAEIQANILRTLTSLEVDTLPNVDFSKFSNAALLFLEHLFLEFGIRSHLLQSELTKRQSTSNSE